MVLMITRRSRSFLPMNGRQDANPEVETFQDEITGIQNRDQNEPECIECHFVLRLIFDLDWFNGRLGIALGIVRQQVDIHGDQCAIDQHKSDQ